MPLPVLAMMLCTFCVGTAESVIAGILPDIARQVGVSLSATGLLITVYAAVVVVSGPCVTALTGRLPRAALLPGMMTVFVLGNVIAALAPGYGTLVAGRVVSALTHSTLIAVAVAAARDMAPPERRAAAGARITLGIGLATVVGVPAGTLVGNGWGWRATFWALAALGALSVLLLLRYRVPEATPSPEARVSAPAAAGRPLPSVPAPLLLVALVIVLGTGGVFALYTFATPYLTQAAGFGTSTVTVLLWLYGLGGIAGNTLGARAADRNLSAAVHGSLATAAAGLLLLALCASVPWAVAALFCVLGAAYFATIPALNSLIVASAGRVPPTMALTVNNSAFCVGIALGSWLGGFLLDGGHGLLSVPLWGAALTAGALLLSAATAGRRRDIPLEVPSSADRDGPVRPVGPPSPSGTAS